MVLTAVISTLMVLFCGSGDDFQDLWDTSGSVNDPDGMQHELPLPDLIARDENFKSTKVASWNSQQFDFVSISACSLYGDIWWTTEFNASRMDSLLDAWAVGSNITYSSANGSITSQEVVFDTANYRLYITPGTSPTEFAWFAISVGSLSYGSFPIAFIAKDPSTPFRLPEILDGYLGCWPNSDLANSTFMVTETGASYEICKTHCGTDYTVVAIKKSTECHCGDLVDDPVGQDDSYCFLNCPGNDTQKCGGFQDDWQSVYHLPGPDMPGATNSKTIFTSIYNDVEVIKIDISQLEATAGDPAFIEDIVVTSNPPDNTYQIFYSQDPCINDTLLQFIKDSVRDFPTAGNTTSLELILVRCLQIQLSAYSLTVAIKLTGPTNTDHIEVPVVVIQGTKMVDVTTTTTSTIMSSYTSTTTSTITSDMSQPSSATTTPDTVLTTSSTTTQALPADTTTPDSPTTTSTTTSTTPTPYTLATTTEESTTSQASVQTEPPKHDTTTTPSSTTYCSCNCNDIVPQTNLTAAELQEKIETIQKQLAVNTTELSSYIRAKTSAKDDRPTAVSIGAVGVALLVTVFGSIILIDSSMLVRDLMMLGRNIKGFFSE